MAIKNYKQKDKDCELSAVRYFSILDTLLCMRGQFWHRSCGVCSRRSHSPSEHLHASYCRVYVVDVILHGFAPPNGTSRGARGRCFPLAPERRHIAGIF